MTKLEKMDYLIIELLSNMPEYQDVSIPSSENEKWNLLRSLFNIRTPGLVSDEFILIQDELLQQLTSEKGITDSSDLVPVGKHKNIYLWQGDITTLKCDAIVNAANSQLLGCFQPLHNCIDNIIHTMAGVQLRNECYQLMSKQGLPEATGQAKITKGYNLPSKYVIHTVGPISNGVVNELYIKQLESCYRACLQLAIDNNLGSMAFCCISTGVFGFPNKKAAEIAIETVSKCLKDNKTIRVIFNVYTDLDHKIYKELLG